MGYEDGTHHICQLIKMLYGLKQSGREWNIELNGQLLEKGFKHLWSDPCVYTRQDGDKIAIITVWVDNLLLFTPDHDLMDALKAEIQSMFNVTDLGDPKKIVGIEITWDQTNGTLLIMQTKYIESILQTQGLKSSNSVKTPTGPKIQLFPNEEKQELWNQNHYASLIGSLMFVAVAMRPDIAYSVNRLASFTANPDLTLDCSKENFKVSTRYQRVWNNVQGKHKRPTPTNNHRICRRQLCQY